MSQSPKSDEKKSINSGSDSGSESDDDDVDFDDTCSFCGAEEEFGDCHKTCEKCGKLACLECVGITGCQTTDCLCHQCYDYKCEECGADLDNSETYVWDGDKWTLPLCNDCHKN